MTVLVELRNTTPNEVVRSLTDSWEGASFSPGNENNLIQLILPDAVCGLEIDNSYRIAGLEDKNQLVDVPLQFVSKIRYKETNETLLDKSS